MKTLSRFFTLLLITQIAFSQITNIKTGQALSTMTLPPYADAGTIAYSSGTSRFMRISNKWVNLYVSQGQTFLSGISTLSYSENTLPCNFEIKSGNNNTSGSFQWTPSSTLPTLTGTISTSFFNHSGNCSFAPNQSFVGNPTNIQLPILSSTPITTNESFAGQLIFTGPDGALNYNNGASWRSVWPNNNSDYTIENWQKIKFGNNGYIKNSEIITNGFVSNTGVAIGFNSNKLTINEAGVDLYSSIRVPIRTTTVSTTLDLNDHVLIISGDPTGGLNITLPTATSGANKGLVYKILNHSTASVTLSQSVIVGWSVPNPVINTLNANSNITIIADGMWWRKIAD